MKPKLITRSWKVGRYTATLIIERLPTGGHRSHCDWDPHQPKRMGPVMEAEWQAGLHIAIASIRAELKQEVKR